MMNDCLKEQILTGMKAGVKKGWGGYLWMLKILLPISFFTSILVFSGFLEKINFLIEPVMGLLSLPAMASVPLLIGFLTGIYGAVAAMMALPLTTGQMTLIAIFLLISHNIIQESIVQGKSGGNTFVSMGIRVVASVITTIIAALFIDTGIAPSMTANIAVVEGQQTFTAMLSIWGINAFQLCLQIFCIIMPLMMVLEIMKATSLIRHIVRISSPALKLFGQSPKTGVLWLTAVIFGLTYGSAVIVEETQEGNFQHNDLAKLHLSIGINHAMIEDPALFLPLGISAFWLWIPRLLAAVIAVQLFRLYCFFSTMPTEKTSVESFAGPDER